MDLHDGRFLDNGGCGYVLKPEYLRSGELSQDPPAVKHRTRPMFFSIKVSLSIPLPAEHEVTPTHTSWPVAPRPSDH